MLKEGDLVKTTNPYFKIKPTIFDEVWYIKSLHPYNKQVLLKRKNNPKIWMYEEYVYIKK